jgi:hypothetical protein
MFEPTHAHEVNAEGQVDESGDAAAGGAAAMIRPADSGVEDRASGRTIRSDARRSALSDTHRSQGLPTEQQAIEALTSDTATARALDDALQPNGWYLDGTSLLLSSRITPSPLTAEEAQRWLARARSRGWIEDAPIGGLAVTEKGRKLAGLSHH